MRIPNPIYDIAKSYLTTDQVAADLMSNLPPNKVPTIHRLSVLMDKPTGELEEKLSELQGKNMVKRHENDYGLSAVYTRTGFGHQVFKNYEREWYRDNPKIDFYGFIKGLFRQG